MVATFQHDGLTRYLDFRLAANQDHPLVVRLNISGRSDVRRTHDSLHHEIVVGEEDVNVLAGTGR